MTSEELLQKVRKIEIKTHGLSKNIFAGEYHSQFKGRGMAFSEVREYQPGDDVRSIDWNVTARMNRPYVKIYEEERELTVMLLVDVSGSRNFGTVSQMKRDTMAEVAATLAFSTIENNDKVGVIFFSDRVEKFIPPKKGKSHVLHIIRELLSFEPEHTGTDINAALEFLTNAQKRRCTAFVISDFIGKPIPDNVLRPSTGRPIEQSSSPAKGREVLEISSNAAIMDLAAVSPCMVAPKRVVSNRYGEASSGCLKSSYPAACGEEMTAIRRMSVGRGSSCWASSSPSAFSCAIVCCLWRAMSPSV